MIQVNGIELMFIFFFALDSLLILFILLIKYLQEEGCI